MGQLILKKQMVLYLPYPVACVALNHGLAQMHLEPRWLLRFTNGVVLRACSVRRDGAYVLDTTLCQEIGGKFVVHPKDGIHRVLPITRCWTTPEGELAADTTEEQRVLARWIVDVSTASDNADYSCLLLSQWLKSHSVQVEFEHHKWLNTVDRQLAAQLAEFFAPIPEELDLPPAWLREARLPTPVLPDRLFTVEYGN